MKASKIDETLRYVKAAMSSEEQRAQLLLGIFQVLVAIAYTIDAIEDDEEDEDIH